MLAALVFPYLETLNLHMLYILCTYSERIREEIELGIRSRPHPAVEVGRARYSANVSTWQSRLHDLQFFTA